MFFRSLLALAGLPGLAALFLLFQQNHAVAAPLGIASLLLLSVAFRGYPALRGFSFTVLIFAAVSLAVTYPTPFLRLGNSPATILITPLIQLIMFGMGTEMSLADFGGVVRTPKPVLIGLVGHFTIMPLLGFSLATLFRFPPEIAAGVILVGSMPCGMASNVMSYLAKANLALSITLTAVATLLSPFLTPLIMKTLGGQFVSVDALKMMFDIVKMVILPIGAGLLFNRFLKGRAEWLDRAMPLLSMAGIATIIVIITAAGRDNLIQLGPLLFVCAFLHNTGGYLFGYWGGRLLGMPERDCRTIAIEVGMQNAGLASGLAKEMGKAATIGLVPAIFGPLMNITGSVLASWWHRREPEE
jgi:bile acid:Na+ symporter, BASS family